MFLLTLTCGIVAVVAVALSPTYVRAVRIGSAPRLGGVLIVASATLALVAAAHRRHPDGRALFLVAFVLLLAGALLVVADDTGEDSDGGDGEPPWWPEFEAGFRRYARRPRTPSQT